MNRPILTLQPWARCHRIRSLTMVAILWEVRTQMRTARLRGRRIFRLVTYRIRTVQR